MNKSGSQHLDFDKLKMLNVFNAVLLQIFTAHAIWMLSAAKDSTRLIFVLFSNNVLHLIKFPAF